MQWISVADQLPPLDTAVLIVCWDRGPYAFLGVLRASGWRTIPDDEDRFPLETTSHWMPLPDPPVR